jgi:acetyltransferase-like isoleucine patch superfamily enzyme
MRFLTKLCTFLYLKVLSIFSWLLTFIKFKLNGVDFKSDFISRGIPILNVNLKGQLIIGRRFMMQSGKHFNMIGRQQPCYFIVGRNAILRFGDNVGVSCASFVCHNQIIVADGVRIGGGVVIYDTDFHSLDVEQRLAVPENLSNVKTFPVTIEENAFIGAHSIILKGVTIGKNSVIGAGSVVSKSVPNDEIWAGNPARFIRRLKN